MDKFTDFLASVPWWGWVLFVLLLIAIYDVFIQKKKTILHNFPIVGHLRYFLEKVGPELRQYIVANNREELPFNRSQRSWVYASAKGQNNYQGFGTDQDQYSPGHVFINSSMFPYVMEHDNPNHKKKDFLPCGKVIGEYNKRKRPFRPYSAINISAMSFGSLSKNATKAMNLGALECGCYHNTGEGGLSPYHKNGADVMFHIGTGYFGVRTDDGNLSFEKLKKLTEENKFIRAIEFKLSQGAKPGKGGVLPAAKITKEISEIRGVPLGQDVISPSHHKAFSNIPEMIDVFDKVAEQTGLPVGFKAAVGKMEMWIELADFMKETGRGPDFITIDGGEGGTGAAPPSFANHVSLPWVFAFSKVYRIFVERGIADRVVFIGSGKLGFPSKAMMAFAMGIDIIHVAREAMMSVGCIQAQVCHTNECPAGIATQNKWLQSGLKPDLKAKRFANYVKSFRKEVVEITHACGYEHPCQMTMDDVSAGMGDNNVTLTLRETYGYNKFPVPFKSMKELAECVHMGGLKSKEKAEDNQDEENIVD